MATRSRLTRLNLVRNTLNIEIVMDQDILSTKVDPTALKIILYAFQNIELLTPLKNLAVVTKLYGITNGLLNADGFLTYDKSL
jgi:hypothetical protein